MSAEIAWAVTRNNSAFLLKKRNCPKPFSTDPMNLTNKHSQRYTGLVNKKAVAVAPAADNKGFTVTIKGGKGSYFEFTVLAMGMGLGEVCQSQFRILVSLSFKVVY